MITPHVKNSKLRVLGFILTFTIGCGEAAPELETWPASGTVVDQNGKPLEGGAIQLETKSDAYLHTLGTVESDGSFTLRTQRRGHKYQGAVSGTYNAIIHAQGKGADGNAFPVQFRVREPITIEKRDNELTLKIRR